MAGESQALRQASSETQNSIDTNTAGTVRLRSSSVPINPGVEVPDRLAPRPAVPKSCNEGATFGISIDSLTGRPCRCCGARRRRTGTSAGARCWAGSPRWSWSLLKNSTAPIPQPYESQSRIWSRTVAKWMRRHGGGVMSSGAMPTKAMRRPSITRSEM